MAQDGSLKSAQAARRRCAIEVTLLGQFGVRADGIELDTLGGRRAHDLFAFLLVHRGRPMLREVVADQLWRDCKNDPRKQLRQALWQLQHGLRAATNTHMIDVTADTIAVLRDVSIDADVARLEHAQRVAHGREGAAIGHTAAVVLEEAVHAYSGDFMPSSYQDWCIVERERYRAIYLALLDKLMGYAESTSNYEDGLHYGELVLAHDVASERTHRRMMWLRHLSGDRTGALRQYDTCVRALRRELAIDPSPTTTDLASAIRNGKSIETSTTSTVPHLSTPQHGSLAALAHLTHLQHTLVDASDHAARALASLGGDTG